MSPSDPYACSLLTLCGNLRAPSNGGSPARTTPGFPNPTVIDVKTRQPVTVCRENPQMISTRSVAAATGAQESTRGSSTCARDGYVRTDSHVFDVFELESFADERRRCSVRSARTRRAPGSTISVNSGDHCRYCPALQRSVPPRTPQLARSMVPDLQAVQSRIAGALPDRCRQGMGACSSRSARFSTRSRTRSKGHHAAQTPIHAFERGRSCARCRSSAEDLNRSKRPLALPPREGARPTPRSGALPVARIKADPDDRNGEGGQEEGETA